MEENNDSFSCLKGLFESNIQIFTYEQRVLEEVVEGSRHHPRDIIGIAFAGKGSDKLDELYLTSRGMLEYLDPRHKENYQKLFNRAKKVLLLRFEHEDMPPKKPFAYFYALDNERVLALYVSRQSI